MLIPSWIHWLQLFCYFFIFIFIFYGYTLDTEVHSHVVLSLDKGRDLPQKCIRCVVWCHEMSVLSSLWAVGIWRVSLAQGLVASTTKPTEDRSQGLVASTTKPTEDRSTLPVAYGIGIRISPDRHFCSYGISTSNCTDGRLIYQQLTRWHDKTIILISTRRNLVYIIMTEQSHYLMIM